MDKTARLPGTLPVPVQPPRDAERRRKRHRSTCALLALVLVSIGGLTASNSALAQKVFTDTEFDFDDHWSLYGPYVIPDGAPNAQFTAQQSPANGKPGAHLEVTMARPTVNQGDAAVWGAVINDTLAWDPAEQADGPLGRLDFVIDTRDGGAWTLAVKQGEYVWLALAKRKFGVAGAWITLPIDCLDEADFVALPGSAFVIEDQPVHPDFSANGAPVSFGIGAGLSCPATADCSVLRPIVFGLDNLQVTARPPLQINAGLTDAWFEPATSGQGILHVVFPGIELIFLSWFTYDTERPPAEATAILGEPGHRWLTAQGGYEGDTAMLDIYLTQGGVFDADDPPPGPPEAVGTMTLEWCDCEKGRLAYSMPSLELSGTLELQRIVPDHVALCEALQP